MSSLDSTSDLIWDRQQNKDGIGIWQGQRTILDNVNYINHITTLNLTGTVNTSTTTNSHINGAKGINVGLNMTASGNGYNMIAKVNSTGGVFNIGQWEDRFELFYIAQNLINNNSNGYTYRATLLNQNGDSNFPGVLNANQLKASGTNMNIANGLVTQLDVGTTRIFKDGIAISNPSTKNDQGWIRVTGNNESNTILEIATGDDGGAGEQIVVRQYNTSNNVARQAILLNTSGNTSFPGNVSASSFSGNASSATKILDRGTHGEAASGTSTPDPQAGMLDNSGMYMTRGYNSSNTPSAYGNVINLAGAGSGQIFCSWTGGNNAITGYMYYRSHTDCNGSGAGWGPYYRLLDTRDSSSFASSSHTHEPLYCNTGYISSNLYFGDVSLYHESANYFTIRYKNQNNVGLNFHFYPNDTRLYIQPAHDNGGVCGTIDHRWSQVCCVNSSMSTSDIRKKREISIIGQDSEYEDTKMSDKTLINFINGLKPVVYKRIKEESESNRPHHGLIAQDIESLMIELNIKDHAGFIKSPVMRDIKQKSIDKETGKEIINYIQEVIKDEYSYALRYEEFIADIIRYSQLLYKELQDLKEKYTLLEKKINS